MSEEAQATEEQAAAPAEDWRQSLPEAFREAPYFKGNDTPEAVLEALENAASWQGNSIRIPGPTATDEQKDEFLQKAIEKLPGLMKTPDPYADDINEILSKLGKPEEPSGYKAPEGVEVPPELMAQAHEAGLTQKQFETLVAKQNENVLQLTAEQEAKIKEQEDKLKADWGAAIEDRKSVVGEYLAGEGVPTSLRDAYANNQLDAETVKWLYSQAEASEEGRAVEQQNDGRTGKLTPAEAAAQRDEVWARLASMRPTDRGYNELLAKKRELTKLALGA